MAKPCAAWSPTNPPTNPPPSALAAVPVTPCPSRAVIPRLASAPAPPPTKPLTAPTTAPFAPPAIYPDQSTVLPLSKSLPPVAAPTPAPNAAPLAVLAASVPITPSDAPAVSIAEPTAAPINAPLMPAARALFQSQSPSPVTDRCAKTGKYFSEEFGAKFAVFLRYFRRFCPIWPSVRNLIVFARRSVNLRRPTRRGNPPPPRQA